MKHGCLILASIVALVLLPKSAFSADLTINFNGQFVVPTCTFTVNGGNSTNLGSYPHTYFNTSTVTPFVTIPIVATGCTAGINTIHLGFSGAVDAFNNQLFAVNGSSGVAGVAISLLNSTGSPIAPGSTVNWTGVDPSQPSNTYNMFARFSKTTGAITAGTVNVPITINFTYN